MRTTSAGVSTASAGPWYRTLNRDQWYTLFAANLGWVFDGYETYALILTVALAFRQLSTKKHSKKQRQRQPMKSNEAWA